MSISPHHRAISPPTPAPSPQPVLHTSIRLANNAAAVASSSPPHPLSLDPHDPSQLLKHLSLVLPHYTQSARFKFVSELAHLFSLRELAHLSSVITPRLKVDFLSALPIEVSLNILSFIDDPKTLARASCVSRFWRSLVNDEHTWKAMCLKHKYRRRGSSNAALHTLDDRLVRSITASSRASALAASRPGHLSIAGSNVAASSVAPGPSSSASGLSQASTANTSSTLGVLLEQPIRPTAMSHDGDDVDHFNDQDDAAVLVSLYQRYRDRGLDPSNALHELRTLHDLFLSKQDVAHGSLNDSMSQADLAFYAQLQEIVQEESRARYGDDDALESASSYSSFKVLATPTDLTSASSSSHLGWLSAAPSSAVASSSSSQPSRPIMSSSPSVHAISGAYRTAAGRLDRLQGWQQPSMPAAAFTTPRIQDADTSASRAIASGNNDSDEAMDMDDQDDLASTIASSSAAPASTRPLGQPPNAPLLASLPHHDSPTGRFSASSASAAASAASPSANTHAASRASPSSSNSLVPGPRELGRSHVQRNARIVSDSSKGRRGSASVDQDDSAATTGLGLGGASTSRSPTHQRSAIAGPLRHSNAPPSAAHIHRHRSTKVPFSYRTHFKMAYLTESNWRKGGRLQTQHVSADAGHVVTSLAIDSEWIVVGMANSKIHVFSAQTGLYAHTLLGHDAGVWCLTLISRTNGKGKKNSNSNAEASGSGKGKMVITDPEDGSGGKPYQVAADGDLRLVHHDPRPDAADALLSPPASSIELPDDIDVFGSRRLPSSTSSTPTAAGKARQIYGHGETLEWFHKARHALRRQQSARRAAAAAAAAAASSSAEGSRGSSYQVNLDDSGLGAADSDADLSIRSEGPSLVHRELRSSNRARADRDNARAIAEAEAGAIRDAVMADGTGQVSAQLAESIRRNGGEMAAAAEADPDFPEKLYALVGDPSTDADIRWSKDGARFVYILSKRLTEQVLPRYFQHDQITLFLQQLDIYEFNEVESHSGLKRSSQDIEKRVFSHPNFHRDHPGRLAKVLKKGRPGRRQDSSSGGQDFTMHTDFAESHTRSRTASAAAAPLPSGNALGMGNPCGSVLGYGNEHAIVVSGGCDRDVRVWDLHTGECKHVLHGHTSTVRCLKVLDGKPIAVSGSRDSTLRVWNVETGEHLHLLAGHQHSVRCIEVAGNKVASGSYDGTCRVWDLDTGRCLHTLRGHIHYIYAVAFDGKRVATGSLDSTVRIWSAETGDCLALFQGHTSLVGQLQLLDNTLVTGGSDGRVIVFSLKTYECLHRLCAHDNSVTCLQFDDRYIITGGNDGRVKLWDFNTGKFIREICEPCEQVWKVSYRDDKVVVLCKRGDKTCMDVITFRPAADEM